MLYLYKVKSIDRILDGDTIDLTVDLGFGVGIDIRLRLLFVDTPEIRGDEREQGLIAKAFVEEKLANAQEILVQTFKGKEKGSFNRWLGVIMLDGVSLNQLLLEEGYASLYTAHKDIIPKTTIYPK